VIHRPVKSYLSDIISIVNTSHRPIYLDYAAATPVADFVVEAMMPYLSDIFYNPSSSYFAAVTVRREYESAKSELAQSFGAKGDELVMTAGATESVNLAFHQSHGHVITTAIEHPAVLEAAKKRDHTLVTVSQKGRVAVEDIIKAIQPDTDFISVGLANSELGTIQPIRKLAQAIDTVRKERVEQGNATPLLFHCDASQGFGLIDIHVAQLGVDLLTLNAAKIYGPKQVGLLWIKPSVEMTPDIVGGGQERGLRSGTENIAGVIGFSAAAVRAAATQKSESVRIASLRDMLQKCLAEEFPSSAIVGDVKHRLPGHLSMAFAGIDAERIIFMVEDEVLVATGSACSANKQTASHVLTAIGLDEDHLNGSLRMTLGSGSNGESIQRAADVLIKAIRSEYTRLGLSA
jgi:cysteine desulfurase